MFNISIRVLKV